MQRLSIFVCAFVVLITPPALFAEEKAGVPRRLGEELVAEGEAAVIEQLVKVQVGMMKANPTMKGLRGQHPKTHGFVHTEFAVRSDIPKEYRVGLFGEAKSYKAIVRFSNGGQLDDTKPDARGMAIKVTGVKGPRAMESDGRDDQDFILLDSETFFAADPRTMLEFLTAAVASARDPEAMKRFAEKDPRTAARAQALFKAPPTSPLAIQYWSTVPFKLGDGAVKYTVRPAAGNTPRESKSAAPDFLRAAMADHLTAGKKSATFELCIIPQTDPATMPVEDATVRWESEPVPVATITIPAQTFDTAERRNEYEGASFDVWHALAEHRPLGGLNRARKAIYPASVKTRQAERR